MAARRTFGRFLSLAVLVAAEIAAVGALTAAFAPIANAQFFDDRYPFLERRRYRRYYEPPPQEERQQDFSRAPAPDERKADAPPVTTRILVLGDSLADWLAYGLEEALAETPEIGVVRKHKAFSGLIKYDSKADTDWAQVAREHIATEKPNAIIMLLGIADRQTIREEPKEQKPDEAKKQDSAKPGEQKNPAEQAQDGEQPNIAGPERDDGSRKSASGGSYEYRSEEWEEAYSRKIDETIAALKTANVPVLWVGLPSIRGKRSTSDALYLNEFYRARAEAAGIMYVDVWDGFVDENGKYTTSGPDLEGQIRRLRTSDGVHFTKSGARKLAHYVERELRRVLANPVPVALTAPDQSIQQQQPAAPAKPLKPSERPLAGPVFLLTKNTEDTDELLGGGAARRPSGDPVAISVLVKGEAIVASAGRADDHSWPPRVPNTVFNEPLPPSGPPILMVKPPPPPKPPVQTAEPASPPRVAGQQVLQRQVQPQHPPPPTYRGGWRAPPPAYYGPPRGFFGLFR